MKDSSVYLIHVLIVVASVFISFSSDAQISNLHTFSGQPMTDRKESDDVQGSPYFTQDWQTGMLIYDHKQVENVKMRYDASEDRIEIYYNDQPFIPNEELVRGFEFTQMRSGKLVNYQFKNGFDGDGINKKNYLSIIYKGKDLTLAERIRTDKLKVTPAVYGEKEYTQLTLSSSYILIKKGVAQRFKPSKKNFISQFPDLDTKLKKYFKEKEVKFDDYKDLAEIMAFIEE